MQEFIQDQLLTSANTLTLLARSGPLIEQINQVIEQSVKRLRVGKKYLVAGNGGSAADAQHFAGELVSRFYFDRPALPAIALTTDSSILTAIGNDYSYERVFSRQIEALGTKDDLFLGISTSGKSKNILEALKAAKAKGMFAVGLTGHAGSSVPMAEYCDICIQVPSAETPRIQECHLLIEHIICAGIERTLFR